MVLATDNLKGCSTCEISCMHCHLARHGLDIIMYKNGVRASLILVWSVASFILFFKIAALGPLTLTSQA
jgi:hypothetical protein